MKKFTVLLIDDIENNIHVLRLLIQSHFKDVEILSATCSYEAVNMITHQDIDLILSDVQMPGLNGIELASYVNTIKSVKNIPIILISAIYNSKKMIQQGYDAGIVDYISKPIDDELLYSKLAVFINIYNERKKFIHQIAHLEECSITKERFYDLDDYCHLINLDNNVIDLSNIESLKKYDAT